MVSIDGRLVSIIFQYVINIWFELYLKRIHLEKNILEHTDSLQNSMVELHKKVREVYRSHK